MLENHWCVVSTHNGLESHMGLDDLLPSPWPWSSPKISQSPIPHVGKGNRARQHKNENHWDRGDTQGCLSRLASLAFPSWGSRIYMPGVMGQSV